MSPLESVIQFLRISLLSSSYQSSDLPIENIAPIGPGSSYGSLPPILTDPGSGGIIGPFNPIGPYTPPIIPPSDDNTGPISVLPPFNPIGPYNPPNEIPQDIADLLAGR